ncbi:hypothetical protein LEP1GSC073_2288 [Leptospira noguchii str. Cascata]|nr:hypothetical protein LEP1GSC072_0428 [Leptospira noguchii str. Bonito]EMS84458.1 hypothetical protein LEP1GSC073_2288 [Leptospira noguchii str. Cascata]
MRVSFFALTCVICSSAKELSLLFGEMVITRALIAKKFPEFIFEGKAVEK